MGFEAIGDSLAGGLGANIVGGLGTGLQIAGMFDLAASAYDKSSLEGQAYGFQSQIARRNVTIAKYQASDALLRGKANATIAKYQASDALLRGATNENVSRHKTAQLKSTQTAELAARNIDLGSGSALDILTSTDFMGERDALTVRDNANKEAWGHQVEASNFNANASKEAWGHQVEASNFNADADLLAWRAGEQNPGGAAYTSLLGTAGKVAPGWYTMANARTGVATSPTDFFV